MFSTVPPHPLFLLTSLHKRRYRTDRAPFRRPIPGHMLCVVLQGQGHLHMERDTIPIQPHQIYYLQPSMKVEIMPEAGCIEYYVLTFRQVAVARRRGQWSCTPTPDDRIEGPLPPGKLPIRSIKPILDRIECLYRSSRSPATPAQNLQLEFQSLLQAMVEELDERHESDEAGGLAQTIAYMHKHYHEKIKLETLSDIAGLTPTSYSRSFKKANGVSPMEYLARVRVDSSKQLLQQNYSIKEAAESVGIGNAFYFSRVFKRATGLAPAVYVQRRQLGVAVACCFGYEDNLRALGIEPLAEMNGGRHVEQGEEEHAQLVRQQLQDIRQARPDLIIADYRHRLFYEQFKQIAPTVMLEFTMDWRHNHRKIAELVGREREAELNLQRIERRIGETRRILHSNHPGTTVSFLRLYSRKIRMQGIAHHPMNTLLYDELGLRPGGKVPLDIQYQEFDARQAAPPFETDYLYVCKLAETDGAAQLLSRLQMAAGRVGVPDLEDKRIQLVSNWISKSWSPIGQQQIMEELLQGALR